MSYELLLYSFRISCNSSRVSIIFCSATLGHCGLLACSGSIAKEIYWQRCSRIIKVPEIGSIPVKAQCVPRACIDRQNMSKCPFSDEG